MLTPITSKRELLANIIAIIGLLLFAVALMIYYR